MVILISASFITNTSLGKSSGSLAESLMLIDISPASVFMFILPFIKSTSVSPGLFFSIIFSTSFSAAFSSLLWPQPTRTANTATKHTAKIKDFFIVSSVYDLLISTNTIDNISRLFTL